MIQRVLAIPAKRCDRALDLVPHQRRGARPARRTGPQHPVRPARPRPAAHRDPDRAAGLRTDRTPTRRHPPRHRRHLFCRGKNRKERSVPLTRQTVKVLTAWLTERAGQADDPLFPTNRDGPLSRDAVEWLIAKHTATAADRCPSLRTKNVTAHVLRHTTAMTLLQSDISTSVIALWLGPRAREHHPRLPTWRPPPQATSPRPHRTTEHPARAIPSQRQPPRLPRQPLTSRRLCRAARQLQPGASRETCAASRPTRHNARPGITRPMPNSA